MNLDEDEAQSVLEEYTGPRYEIEKKQMMVFILCFNLPGKYPWIYFV